MIIKPKIFLTGASGFIGRNILEQLEDKYEFIAPSSKELDLTNADKVLNFFDKNRPEIVIHAANIGGKRNNIQSNECTYLNLQMFFNIIRCKKFFDRMIMLGSGAEYDKRFDVKEVLEDNFDNHVPTDQYGFYKYICSQYAKNVDFITHLRIFAIFGKYEDYRIKFISNNICRSLYDLPISINQNVYFDYTYINDFIKIIDKFIQNPGKEKFYNASCGEKMDLISIANIIKEVTDSKKEIIIKKEGFNNEYSCNSQKLKNEFSDLEFTNIKESIIELTNYYKDNLNTINKEDLMFD